MNKQVFAKQKSAENRIIKHFGNPTTQSGIYVFYRYNDERQKHCYYIGQAKNLLRRIADHLLEHDHVALSLKKYGLFDNKINTTGWICQWKIKPLEKLDIAERQLITYYRQDPSNEVYNITSGGQGAGKVDINQRKKSKAVDWRATGYNKAYTEIAEQIEKYTTGLTSKGGVIADRKTQELIKKLGGMKK